MKSGGASTSYRETGIDRRNSYPPPAHLTAYGQGRFSAPGPWPRQRPSYYSNTPSGFNPYQREARQSGGSRHHGNTYGSSYHSGQSQNDRFSNKTEVSPYGRDSRYGDRNIPYNSRDSMYNGQSSSYGSRDSSYDARNNSYSGRDNSSSSRDYRYGGRDSSYGDQNGRYGSSVGYAGHSYPKQDDLRRRSTGVSVDNCG